MGFFRETFFLLAVAIAMERPVSAVVEYLDTVGSSGVAFYIPVSTRDIQRKLDQFHDDISGPRLHLPNQDHPVLPGLPNDTHPLYIEFGNYTYQSGVLSEVDLTVAIPFLGLSPTSPLNYSLNIAIFHDRDGGLFPEYALVPFTGVDDILLDENELVVRDVSEVIVRIRYSKLNPCASLESDVEAEFEVFMNEDVNFSPEEPTFEYCNQVSESGDRLCQKINAIRDEVLEAFPNVCVHWHSNDGRSCEASVEEIQITQRFWDEVQITRPEEIQVIATEAFIGHFDFNITYPCLE